MDHLNINSIKNKFNLAESIIKSFDLVLIAESKLGSTFSMNQFRIRGYKIFRHDPNRFGRGLMSYILRTFYEDLKVTFLFCLIWN